MEKEFRKDEAEPAAEETGEVEEETAGKEDSAVEEEIDEEKKLSEKEEELSRRLEELNKEKEDLFQSYIRLKADFENFRRRSREELSQARDQGVEFFVTNLLPVLDNMERAIDASGDPEKWREGVVMVFRQFLEVLAAEGVTPIPSMGRQFDPNSHEAVAKEASPQPENVIIEEMRKGYKFKDKTIRASLVKVSAGEGN